MRKVAISGAVAALVCLLLLAPALGAEDTAFQNLLQVRERLLASPQQMKLHDNWLRCIDKLLAYHKRNPKGGNAPLTLLLAGDLYCRLHGYSGRPEDLTAGLDLFGRVVKGYPGSAEAPEALYQTAETCRRYGRKQEADAAYRELLRAYPASPRATKAAKGAARLKLDVPRLEPAPQASVKTSIQEAAAEPVAAPPEEAAPPPVPKRGPVRAAVVEGVRSWSASGYTRLVIDVSGEASFQGHLVPADPLLHKPKRVFVDISPARRGQRLDNELAIDDALLLKARSAQHSANTVRVVLDVKDIESYKVFALRDPYRVVIDVRGVALPPPPPPPKPETVALAAAKAPEARPPEVKPSEMTRPALPEAPAAKPPKGVSLAEQLGLKVARVVIDPGHGGKDPGAIGPGGVEEKSVVLEIARALGELMRREIGCEVLLTRDSDIFLPLEERTAIANTRKGDLFISIHANACPDRKGRGVETYFLNFTTDKESIRVAARENATSAKNLSDLQMILNDLMLHSKISESSRLAEHVQRRLVNELRGSYDDIIDKGVKKAPFYVLIGAQMPAVLVEASFITNRTEAERLASDAYRQMVAKGIMAGIRGYIEEIEMAARR
jgi:N-acetylmuramoyl-L-alanine amidase